MQKGRVNNKKTNASKKVLLEKERFTHSLSIMGFP